MATRNEPGPEADVLPLLDHQAVELRDKSNGLQAGTVERVRLGRIVLWAGNPRSQEPFDPARDCDLVANLEAHGQKIPCICRHVGDDRIQLIAGCRRFGAISHLSENGAKLELLVELRELSDREAFVLVEAENAARKDVSAYERATYHQWALRELFGDRQSDLAATLNISPTTLSRSLDLVRLPEEVYAIISDRHGLTPNLVSRLSPRCRELDDRSQVIAAALEIGAKGQALPATKAIAMITARLDGIMVPEPMLVELEGTGHSASIRLATRNNVVVTIPTKGLKARERARYIKQVMGEVSGYADRAIPSDV